MAYTIWSQDIFTKGEISPLMYARVSVSPYYNGLKTAKNVITFPQGAAGKRFGTFYRATIPTVTDASQIYFSSMQYLNECVYLIVLIPNEVLIYLEGNLIYTVTGTPVGANELRLIDHTVLDNIFRVTTGVTAPQDITRSADASLQITNFDTVNNIFTITAPSFPVVYNAGSIYPVRFSFTPGGGNSLFTSNPQVLSNKTYFLYFLTPTTAQIYNTATDAFAQINSFLILGAGVGNQYITILNTWAMNPTVFINTPTYDFSGGIPYQQISQGVTFTASAMTGTAINITVVPGSSGYTFTANLLGGLYIGSGGVGRILSVTSTTIIVVNSIVSFTTTSAVLGSTVVVTEPAWSDLRGWPRVCSSFQNRAFFANTDLLPNGLWGSVINDYDDFDDSEDADTNAISWYPTSDDINFIRFIVPYRSLTIHTNSGVFSTPLSVETAITPTNFSLTIQDSTPAEAVQPRGIDNQIVILSGNDAHSLLWDGFNNAYQSNIISVANEQLIRDPVDEAAFVDLTRAGSRYMLIVNADGTLAIYQTLISEDVQGFTPAVLEQTFGNAYFRWVATSYDGRGWFVTEREIAILGATYEVTSFTQFTLGVGEAFQFLNDTPFYLLDGNPLSLLANDFVIPPGITPVEFPAIGILPNSVPQIQFNTLYWAVPTDDLDFMLYTSYEDAVLGVYPIQFFSTGINAEVQPYVTTTEFFIEELSFDAKVDCAIEYNGIATSTFPNVPQFNAQNVKIQGKTVITQPNGFGFDYMGLNNEVQTIAHGQPVPVVEAQIGFPINVEIEPLPLSIFQGSTKQANLLTPKHIREVSLMVNDSIGGLVNGVPIAVDNFNEVQIGNPPIPSNGVFEYGIMAGWDDYKQIGLRITHNEPFDFKLIGLFYRVEI